ncbi:hypothetical protein C0992_000177 [Termitomyces sp. T32_za158]|nr:hypothetical protein C0992_000177 [Termitomyces sp. T32_za158]
MGFSRPPKRRKLTQLSPSNGLLPAKDLVKPESVPAAISSCISCHRTLKATHLTCARCSAPTCAICSRTCTACPSSMPPTPLLTRSPSPNLSPPSPKRPALSIHPTNTHRGEKRRTNADEESQEGFLQTLAEFDLAPGCGRTVCRNCCTEDKERCVSGARCDRSSLIVFTYVLIGFFESASTACHDCLASYD